MIFCARATRGLRRPSFDARSGRSVSPHPWKANKQAWRQHMCRSMRAVKGSLGHSPEMDNRGSRKAFTWVKSTSRCARAGG